MKRVTGKLGSFPKPLLRAREGTQKGVFAKRGEMKGKCKLREGIIFAHQIKRDSARFRTGCSGSVDRGWWELLLMSCAEVGGKACCVGVALLLAFATKWQS